MESGRSFKLWDFGIHTRRSGKGLIASLVQTADGSCFLRWAVPDITIDTWGPFAWFSVTRLTANALPLNEWVNRCCKAFTLPHLPACVAFTIRACSRRTIRWALPPVDGVPVHWVVGDRTSRCCHCCHLLCLLSRFLKLSRDERPEGSRPAFAWGDVAVCSTPIRPITGRHSLAPSSFTRRSIGSPYGLPSTRGERRAYRVPLLCPSGVRSALSADSAYGHEKRHTNLFYRTAHLLVQASQRLWLVVNDDVYQAFTCVDHTTLP